MNVDGPILRVHALVALATFVCDGFLWGFPALAFVVGFVGGVCGLGQMARGRILTGGLATLSYVAALLLAFVVTVLHIEGAEGRAGSIIRALDAYRTAHGAYPRELAELTPDYLPRIPRAKDTVWLSDYSYAPPVPGRDAVLAFSIIPPVSFFQFNLESRKWEMPDI